MNLVVLIYNKNKNHYRKYNKAFLFLYIQEITSMILKLLLILTINSSPNLILQIRTSSLSFRQTLFSMILLSLQILIKAFTIKFWRLLLFVNLIFYSLTLLSIECSSCDMSYYLRRGINCRMASVFSLLLLMHILMYSLIVLLS